MFPEYGFGSSSNRPISTSLRLSSTYGSGSFASASHHQHISFTTSSVPPHISHFISLSSFSNEKKSTNIFHVASLVGPFLRCWCLTLLTQLQRTFLRHYNQVSLVLLLIVVQYLQQVSQRIAQLYPLARFLNILAFAHNDRKYQHHLQYHQI